jgi:phosphatidylethanolamine/phosphatidyl-N-methylethanolamine N-methyltransferase
MKKWIVIVIALCGTYFFYKSDAKTFLVHFFKNPTDVGSIMPTSYFAGYEITKPIRESKQPLKILEAGAGTGPITEMITRYLKPTDTLDAIEIDPTFCQMLKEKFNTKETVRVHSMPIEEWHPDYQYDLIISSLPFNNFSVQQVDQILKLFKKLIKPDGIFTYIGYMGAPLAKRIFLNKTDYADFMQKRKLLADFYQQFGTETIAVWLNLPPVYVYRLCIT